MANSPNSPSLSTPASATLQAMEDQVETQVEPGVPSPIIDSSLSRSDQSTILGDGTSDLSLTTCRESSADNEATVLQTPKDPAIQKIDVGSSLNDTTLWRLPTPGIAYRTRSKDKETLKPKFMIKGLKDTLKEDIEGDKKML